MSPEKLFLEFMMISLKAALDSGARIQAARDEGRTLTMKEYEDHVAENVVLRKAWDDGNE